MVYVCVCLHLVCVCVCVFCSIFCVYMCLYYTVPCESLFIHLRSDNNFGHLDDLSFNGLTLFVTTLMSHHLILLMRYLATVL